MSFKINNWHALMHHQHPGPHEDPVLVTECGILRGEAGVPAWQTAPPYKTDSLATPLAVPVLSLLKSGCRSSVNAQLLVGRQ